MDKKTPKLFVSLRLLLSLFVFFGVCTLYMQRINMGIAILCMVNHTWVMNQTTNANLASFEPSLNQSSALTDHSCHLEQNNSTFSDGSFLWPKKTQGVILSSFFYGYFITQIPGGWLSLKIGGVKTFGISILLGSITTLLMPFAARQSYNLLILTRFLTGFFHGPVFPSLGSVWINWAPPQERSRILGLAFSGVQIGNIIALPLGGYLCVSGFDGGWPSIFYIYGLVGVIWSLIFMFVMSESPKDQKCISNMEKLYILSETKKPPNKPKSTPWGSIFTSRICWTLTFCTFCFNWGSYLYITQIPSFMKDVLKFDVKSNGRLSSIPYIVCWFIVLISSFLGDHLITNKILSRLNVRKLFTSFAMFVPMVALMLLSFVTCASPYLGVALLTLGFAFNGCAGSAGFFINTHEIGGPYNSILVGMLNMVGTIPGFIGPYVVGLITSNHKQEEWRIVLWITSFLYLIGGITYILFADVNLQPWAKQEQDKIGDDFKASESLLKT